MEGRANGQARPVTASDAQLLMRLWELRQSDRLYEARQWFESFQVTDVRDFDRVWTSDAEARARFRLIVGYWEMACSLVVSGALHAELFFQTAGELLYVWQKIKLLIEETRLARKNPLSCHNMEKVVRAYVSWLDGQAPEAVQAMRDRVHQGR
jgi:hypothetical protein